MTKKHFNLHFIVYLNMVCYFNLYTGYIAKVKKLKNT